MSHLHLNELSLICDMWVNKITYLLTYMRVSVVKQVKGGTRTRQREERRLIFQLGTLAPGGLNIDFKFL